MAHVIVALAALAFLCRPAAATQVWPFATLPEGSAVGDVVADATDHVYVTGNRNDDAFIAKLGPDGKELLYWTVIGGSGTDRAAELALDGTGAAYITGTSTSLDFPTTPGALQPALQNEDGQAFVVKVNAQGEVEYATFVGGTAETGGGGIAVNATGEVVVTGFARGAGFPITPGAALTSDDENARFVARIDSTGSTLLAGFRTDSVSRVATDAAGNLFVAGRVYGSHAIPISPGAIQAEHQQGACGGSGWFAVGCFYAFVTKLNPDGTEILFSTWLTGSHGSSVEAMHVDPEGNVLAAGNTNSTDFPVTEGVLLDHHIARAPRPPQQIGPHPAIYPPQASGYVAKLNSAGTDLLFSTYFSGTQTDTITDMWVAESSIYITGTASSSDLPGLDAPFCCLPSGYVSQIAADGSRVAKTALFDRDLGSLQLTLGRTGPYVAQDDRSILRFDLYGEPDRVTCVTDSANLERISAVTPGQLLSLFGANLAAGVQIGEPSPGGFLPTELAGSQVTFNGIAGPLLYVSGEQVNVQAPYEMAGADTVVIEVGAESFTYPVVERQPAAFLGADPDLICDNIVPRAPGGGGYVYPLALALNESGFVNSCETPAEPGSLVTVFLNGVGVTGAAIESGAVTPLEATIPLDLPVTFEPQTGLDAAYLSRGAISSVWELHVRVPGTTDGYAVFAPEVGGVPLTTTRWLAIWVRR